ncbi:hypothetical protein Q0P22_14265 [Staphylococcus aureus]|nr:hypothetical protein [Staphylococcus aureus]MDN8977788.1 hypothetical protein [Staphylococcus aureus]
MKNMWKSKVYEDYHGYMRNESLELDVVINRSEIRITTDGTVFVNEKRLDFIDVEELLSLITKLRIKGKKSKVKLKGINKLKARINEVSQEYEKEYKRYAEKLDVFIILWENFGVDIKMGYSDDVIFNILKVYENELEDISRHYLIRYMDYKNIDY